MALTSPGKGKDSGSLSASYYCVHTSPELGIAESNFKYQKTKITTMVGNPDRKYENNPKVVL